MKASRNASKNRGAWLHFLDVRNFCPAPVHRILFEQREVVGLMSLAPIHRYIGRIIHLIRKEKGMRQSELALLTGLKQPNLSRIENGLVSPRQVTLEKIAKALGVEVQVFYSESKVQEVERKWAASLGPKHAALMLAGKLVTVPLIETVTGYPNQLTASGEPQGPLEVVLQLTPLDGEHEGAVR